MRGAVRASVTIGVAILTIGARASARPKPFTVVIRTGSGAAQARTNVSAVMSSASARSPER